MDSQLISVIVPIYNVEKYLPQCVESIVKQTYRHLEVILVDDGSPDSCGKMCDEFALKDERIKVIHKENGGLSDARNAGLNIATGRWVFFVDSDDYISFDCLEILYNLAVKENADIVIGDEIKFYDSVGSVTQKKNPEIAVYNKEEAIKRYFYRTIPGYACGKLYKREIVENILFPKGKLFEDAFVVYKYINNAEKIVFIDKVVLFYRQRKGSIVNSKFTRGQLDILEANKGAAKFFWDSSMEIKNAIMSKRFVSAVDVLRKMPTDDSFTEEKLVIKEINATKKSALKNKNNTLIVRLLAVFSLISPSLLKFIARLRKHIKISRV